MPLITADGIHPVDGTVFQPVDANTPGTALDLPNDAVPEMLRARLGEIEVIRIPFPNSGDGRGFSLARRLRDLGYRGRLRARGHVISDQFRYALECGFDEVEISDEQARRQPWEHWRGPAAPSYRAKLSRRRGSVGCPSARQVKDATGGKAVLGG